MTNMAIEGLISGFNTTDLINAILDTQVRAPVDGIQAKIAQQTEKLASFQALNANLLSLNIAVQSLGAASLFNGRDTFSSDESILSVSASNNAPLTNFNVQVKNLAKTDQISSNLFISSQDELDLSGKFILNGQSIDLTSSDSLASLAAKINGANTGVKASVIQVAANQNKLVLGATVTGVDRMELREVGTSGVLRSLGLINSDPSQMTYDYTVNADTYGALGKAAALTDVFSTSGKQFSVTDAGGQNTLTVDFAGDMTLEQIRDRINTVSATQGANIAAELVSDNGQSRLRITSETGIPTKFSDPNNVLFDLGIADGIQSEDFSSSVYTIGEMLQLGATNSSTISLSNGDGASSISIQVDFDTDSLSKIKEKMETAIAADPLSDLSVDIISVNGRSRLEIKSGSGQPILDVASDTGNVFETLGLVDAQFKNYDQRGENSQFLFNGVNVNRDSNLVTDLVEGVSLAFLKESSSSVSVTVREDYNNVASVVENFVTAFNKVNDFIKEQTFYDTKKKEKGLLFGESTVRSLRDMMTGQLNRQISKMPGAQITELNNGAGIRLGQIEITNRAGNKATVDLTEAKTVQDILDQINLSGIKVKAQLNTAGTSIDLIDSSSGYGELKVAEVDGGSTAADLGLKGQIFGTKLTGGIIYEGGFSNVTEIGLTFSLDGKLSLDTAKLNRMMNENPEMVKNLFTAANVGFAPNFLKDIQSFTSYGTGALDAESKSITSKIELYTEQIGRYQDRASALEKTLRRRFTSLEVSLSQSQQLSDLITQKLTQNK